MPANIEPIYPIIPKVSMCKVLTADATASKNHDGTSSGAVLLFTAGVNGSRIDSVKAMPLGTNVATVLRLFINNGQDPTVAANNSLFKEVAAPANTINETAAATELKVITTDDLLCLPPNYRLYVVVGTTIAAGLQVTVIGGDY